jgi:hypothetical protein
MAHDNFDKAIIYLLRNLTRNFIEQYKERSINGLPIENAPLVEDIPNATTLEGYV